MQAHRRPEKSQCGALTSFDALVYVSAPKFFISRGSTVRSGKISHRQLCHCHEVGAMTRLYMPGHIFQLVHHYSELYTVHGASKIDICTESSAVYFITGPGDGALKY